MGLFRISLIGLVMMLMVTSSVFAQGNDSRGNDDIIDFDIINVVDDNADDTDDGTVHDWPWQVSLNHLTQDDANTAQSESSLKSGDRFFFTHSNTP